MTRKKGDKSEIYFFNGVESQNRIFIKYREKKFILRASFAKRACYTLPLNHGPLFRRLVSPSTFFSARSTPSGGRGGFSPVSGTIAALVVSGSYPGSFARRGRTRRGHGVARFACPRQAFRPCDWRAAMTIPEDGRGGRATTGVLHTNNRSCRRRSPRDTKVRATEFSPTSRLRIFSSVYGNSTIIRR